MARKERKPERVEVVRRDGIEEWLQTRLGRFPLATDYAYAFLKLQQRPPNFWRGPDAIAVIMSSQSARITYRCELLLLYPALSS